MREDPGSTIEVGAEVGAEVAAEPSRRERKKARTRRRIYDSAMQLFAERGYVGTSIVEICDAADVGHGTFFLHFPTKSALLYEFNERFAEEARETFAEPRDSAAEELVELVERMSQELEARSAIMRAMLAEFFDNPGSRTPPADGGRALPELVTSIIRRGQKRGEFDRAIDPRLAAASFLATAGAIIGGQVFRKGEVSSREVKDQFLRHVFHGLGRTATSPD